MQLKALTKVRKFTNTFKVVIQAENICFFRAEGLVRPILPPAKNRNKMFLILSINHCLRSQINAV